MRRKIFGPDHPSTAHIEYDFALLLKGQREALAYVETGHAKGKVVVTILKTSPTPATPSDSLTSTMGENQDVARRRGTSEV
jgi:hypothetical protein